MDKLKYAAMAATATAILALGAGVIVLSMGSLFVEREPGRLTLVALVYFGVAVAAGVASAIINVAMRIRGRRPSPRA